jgi:Xaa-Pro aminopeptidase
MTAKEELEIKLGRVRNLMDKGGYQGVLFGTQFNFSWLTGGGDNQIIHGTELGFVNLLVTSDDIYIITNNIEMPRVTDEEVEGLDLKKIEFVWTEGSALKSVQELVEGGKLAADHDFPGGTNEKANLDLLRMPLTQGEVSRYRKLSALCTHAMDRTMFQVRPGMDEYEIQGVIAGELMSKGVYPVVLLVGTDERIFQYRHPMPTEKKLKRYCMVVICAQKWGLILNMTRLVHFGAVPDEIVSKYDSLYKVDMAYITATRPGQTMQDIFNAGKEVYEKEGFKGEELKHYQGGTCGYLAREQGLLPEGTYAIQDGEIFAHNPTITGTKIEDSILVKKNAFEVLTITKKWPSREIEYQGVVLKRPEILVR